MLVCGDASGCGNKILAFRLILCCADATGLIIRITSVVLSITHHEHPCSNPYCVTAAQIAALYSTMIFILYPFGYLTADVFCGANAEPRLFSRYDVTGSLWSN